MVATGRAVIPVAARCGLAVVVSAIRAGGAVAPGIGLAVIAIARGRAARWPAVGATCGAATGATTGAARFGVAGMAISVSGARCRGIAAGTFFHGGLMGAVRRVALCSGMR